MKARQGTVMEPPPTPNMPALKPEKTPTDKTCRVRVVASVGGGGGGGGGGWGGGGGGGGSRGVGWRRRWEMMFHTTSRGGCGGAQWDRRTS